MMMPSGIQYSLIVIFFIYGLAFFTMGMALILETGRTQLLASQRAVSLLAIFGLLHGIHEWFEIFLLQNVWLGGKLPITGEMFRVVLLAVSFFPLVLFGTLSLQKQSNGFPRSYVINFGLLIAYLAAVILANKQNPANSLLRADVLARYILAIPGAILTSLALLQRSRQVQKEGRIRLVLPFRLASAAFLMYALTQFFVPKVDFFLASWLNAPAFLDILHFPIQLLRAAVGVLATYGLVRAIQLVEQERREILQAAQAARLEALERVHEELVKRENLRREMIQRTVVAQEDERSRIARELHDESAQLLTAISLSLATLRTEIRPERGALILIDRLQDLSRDMSRQMHRMVHDLRPAQLDDLGLVPALQFLVDEGRQSTGVEVKLSVVGQRSKLDKLVETVIFRAAQEALNNVYRHAKVQTAEMIVNYSPARIIVTVIDQGVGFDSTKEYEPDRGFGLVGMRERLESVRGTLEVQSSPGVGTKIEIIVPLTEKDLLDLIEENRYGSTHPNYAG